MASATNGTTATNGAAQGQSDTPPIGSRVFSTGKPPSLNDFKTLTTVFPTLHYPLASRITKNVPVYDLAAYSSYTADQLSALQDEWYHILLHGPGVFATKHIYTDLSLIDRVNDVYSSIIKKETQQSSKKGDHFATSGSNSRIWNSFSKHCLADPRSFIEYYSNPWLPLISSAWVGTTPSPHSTSQYRASRWHSTN